MILVRSLIILLRYFVIYLCYFWKIPEFIPWIGNDHFHSNFFRINYNNHPVTRNFSHTTETRRWTEIKKEQRNWTTNLRLYTWYPFWRNELFYIGQGNKTPPATVYLWLSAASHWLTREPMISCFLAPNTYVLGLQVHWNYCYYKRTKHHRL